MSGFYRDKEQFASEIRIFKNNPSEGKRVDWLDAFADNYATIVEKSRERNEASFFDDVSNVVNQRSKTTVDSIVQEYQKATGLNQYLQNLAAQDDHVKVAQGPLFQKLSPEENQKIMQFVENRIHSFKGNIHLPALLEDIMTHFPTLAIEDVYDPVIAKELNQLIMQEKGQFPPVDESNNLGQIDTSVEKHDEAANNDFFHNMSPKGQ